MVLNMEKKVLQNLSIFCLKCIFFLQLVNYVTNDKSHHSTNDLICVYVGNVSSYLKAILASPTQLIGLFYAQNFVAVAFILPLLIIVRLLYPQTKVGDT